MSKCTNLKTHLTAQHKKSLNLHTGTTDCSTYLFSPWKLLWTGSLAAAAAAESPHPPLGSQTPCYMARSPGDRQTLLGRTHLDLYLRRPKDTIVKMYILKYVHDNIYCILN